MKIEAVAVDIDGTITDSKRRICISSIEAIRKAEKNNVPVMIVTGNLVTYGYATSVLVGCSGGIVSENGGVIYNDDKIEILANRKYVDEANRHLLGKLGNELEKQASSDNNYRESEIVYYKDIPKKLLTENLKDFKDLDKIEIYDSGFALHLTDKSVNKGSSLKYLCKKNNINIDKVMGIGDSENDLDFLKVVGKKVAVANADEELKEESDYVCENSYGDGVKEAIEKFVL